VSAAAEAGSRAANALWAKVCEDFAATNAHDAFVRHCHESDELAFAARCYRQRRDALPEDDPEREAIDKRLAAIALLAMSQLELHKTVPTKSNLVRVLAVVAALLALAAIIGLARAMLSV
jgi:hypothetical protein